MSAECCSGFDALAANRGGPTQTETVQRQYAQRLRGAFGRINAKIRQRVIKEDWFGLRQDALAEDPKPFHFTTNTNKTQKFLSWLRRQLRNEVLSVISPRRNEFVDSAYGTGLRFADSALRDAGVDGDFPEIAVAFNLPAHRRTLQQLYTRNYENLQGITEDVANELRDELTRGFAQGHNPTEIARALTERINSVGKWRATLLARTEVINAHTQSSLNRYERAGADTVRFAELSTAEDARVCAVCKSLEGEEHPLGEIRNGSFTFEGTEFRLAPPIHPQCRCCLLPVIG